MILTYEECNTIDRHAKKLMKRAFVKDCAVAPEHDLKKVQFDFKEFNHSSFLNFIHFDCIPTVQ